MLLAVLAPLLTGSAPQVAEAPASAAPSHAEALQARVDRLVAEHEQLPGLAIYVIVGAGDDGERYGAAAGAADPDGTPMTVHTPVRIASNTKTYTAATYLRLWEQDRVALDASLRAILDEDFTATLEGFGYDPDAITARHLLMHAGGLPDHADASYVRTIFDDPQHPWTRAEQLELMGERPGPLWPAGGGFSYSDTGYVLLGHAIERATGQRLARAAREQLGFDALGLSSTWWELHEPVPPGEPGGTPARAHQYLGGAPTHDWSATMDLYGGGGLASSVRDMATFLAGLFRGQVFDDPATLELMRTAPGHPNPEAYRIGLFPRTVAGHDAYSHSGFWGTLSIYVPDLDLAVAGVTLDQDGFRLMAAAVNATIEEVAARQAD